MTAYTFLKQVYLSPQAQSHPQSQQWFSLCQRHYNQFVKLVRITGVENLKEGDFLAVSKVIGKLQSPKTRHDLAREFFKSSQAHGAFKTASLISMLGYSTQGLDNTGAEIVLESLEDYCFEDITGELAS